MHKQSETILIYRIAIALLLVAPGAWANIDRAGNIIDEGGTAPAWIFIVLIIGIALWIAKEQSAKSTEANRKLWDANRELGLQRKSLAESISKIQTLESQISKMRPNLEKFGLIEAVHANFINGELRVADYTELVVRIVEPGFIEDFGPYKGVPTLE